MKITTRIFGEIDIEDDKIIRFPGGIVGFPQLTDFALLHDADKGIGSSIRWMQSMQEPNFAMPVMDPLTVSPDYNPIVEDELLKPIGEFNPESVLVLVTLTVPKDITKMTVNLQAPFVINADERKACQIIVDSDQFPVRFPIYDILEKMKEQK
ncbi:MAG: flagellar assembly protein FliW [Lachnospiraceae bacterium]|nr:flagellar assembly protein FliW [Candidatus Colinaster equi]